MTTQLPLISKLPPLFLVLYFCAAANAQKKEAWYSYDWKVCDPSEACFYSVTEKTDSGWFRHDYYLYSRTLQMRALFEDADCKIQNGYASYYHTNGQLSSSGRRVHGKREGYWVQYHSNGMMADSAVYYNDIPKGHRLRWHRNGFVADSITPVNDSMEVQVCWFDDGSPASAGRLLHGKMHGKWIFWHHNGKQAGEVIYTAGEATSKMYYNEDGSLLTDTAKANREARFKSGDKDWRKYLEQNIVWPVNLMLTTTGSVVVGIEFTINENGKVEDAEVAIPFHPEFDSAALRILTKSPLWEPAMEHNRKVKKRMRQPVTFARME